ncbi:hypothetical protein [Nonomuraea glycinis]|uniref:hypothetical protein n=1 Tax=Nonomuraea glycinis TaxID=2047744 RepID=UPI0033ABF7B5
MKKSLIVLLTGGALLVTGTPALAQTAKPTLGPYGYGTVKLGMSATKAKATRQVVFKRSAGEGSCSGWDLKALPTDKDSVGLYISKTVGVAVIFAQKGVKTPQGIGLGSTLKQVKKAYPKVKNSASGFPYVAVPGNPKASYVFIHAKGKVREMAMSLNTQDCVN